MNVIPGETAYPSTVDIMGTSLDAIQLVFSSVLATGPWLRGSFLIPVPWREDEVKEITSKATSKGKANNRNPLKLGIYWTDDIVTPHLPINRGLRTVVERGKQAGHRVVKWTPPDLRTAKRVHLTFLEADKGHDVHEQLCLSGEPLIPPLRQTFKLRDSLSLTKYQELTVEGLEYERAYSDYWNATGDEDGKVADAMIIPVASHVAVISGKYFHIDTTA